MTYFEFSFFFGIGLAAFGVFAGMIYLSIWAHRKGRTKNFLLLMWGGFLIILALGGITRYYTVRHCQRHWAKYFEEITRSYAAAVQGLDHFLLEFSHSKWSDPIDPDQSEFLIAAEPEPKKYEDLNGRRFLEAPTGLRATRKADGKIDFRWNPVKEANCYQIQRTGTPENPESWTSVHRCCENCFLAAEPGRFASPAKPQYCYRVRALFITPGDDPLYQRIRDIMTTGVRNSKEAKFVYTLRPEDDGAHFIVGSATASPQKDFMILPGELDIPIGESYPLHPVMRRALGLEGEMPRGGVDIRPVTDTRGRWIKGVEPIYRPDGTLDGLLGIDFSAADYRSRVIGEQISPSFFYLFILLSYFGMVAFIVHLQRATERQMKVSLRLQETVGELTVAQKASESALRAKSEFLTNMSHEVRTPMNAVLFFTEEMGRLLRQRCLPEEKGKCESWEKVVSRNGHNLLEMLNDILDFIKLDDNRFEIEPIPISLQTFTKELEPEMRAYLDEHPGIELQFVAETNAPELIMSDPKRLRQILSHLIKNGIKFTEQGIVQVRYGAESSKESRYSFENVTTAPMGVESSIIYFEVIDPGIGISPEQLSTLFEPFCQADGSMIRCRGGTGLGLPVSKRLARLLGGDIFVDSEPGRGSEFTLAFPTTVFAHAPEARPQIEAMPQPQAATAVAGEPVCERPAKPLEGLRILVVDDTRINRIVIVSQIKEAGAEYEEAENGQIAIDRYQAAADAGKPFDVILMDMQMPVMDGYEATRKLREQGCSRPIIAVTAHALSGDDKTTTAAGCDAYLTKPVDRELLLKTILQYRR